MLGALLAIIGLAIILYYLDKYAPSLALLKDYLTLSYLVGGILISAIIITYLSTFFATQRFLNLQTDELYY
jgi:cell division transport system permease protein